MRTLHSLMYFQIDVLIMNDDPHANIWYDYLESDERSMVLMRLEEHKLSSEPLCIQGAMAVHGLMNAYIYTYRKLT